MCRSIIDNYANREYSCRYISLMLYKRCSLLKDYICEGKGPFENPFRIDIAIYYIVRQELLSHYPNDELIKFLYEDNLK